MAPGPRPGGRHDNPLPLDGRNCPVPGELPKPRVDTGQPLRASAARPGQALAEWGRQAGDGTSPGCRWESGAGDGSPTATGCTRRPPVHGRHDNKPQSGRQRPSQRMCSAAHDLPDAKLHAPISQMRKPRLKGCSRGQAPSTGHEPEVSSPARGCGAPPPSCSPEPLRGGQRWGLDLPPTPHAWPGILPPPQRYRHPRTPATAHPPAVGPTRHPWSASASFQGWGQEDSPGHTHPSRPAPANRQLCWGQPGPLLGAWPTPGPQEGARLGRCRGQQTVASRGQLRFSGPRGWHPLTTC